MWLDKHTFSVSAEHFYKSVINDKHAPICQAVQILPPVPVNNSWPTNALRRGFALLTKKRTNNSMGSIRWKSSSNPDVACSFLLLVSLDQPSQDAEFVKGGNRQSLIEEAISNHFRHIQSSLLNVGLCAQNPFAQVWSISWNGGQLHLGDARWSWNWVTISPRSIIAKLIQVGMIRLIPGKMFSVGSFVLCFFSVLEVDNPFGRERTHWSNYDVKKSRVVKCLCRYPAKKEQV